MYLPSPLKQARWLYLLVSSVRQTLASCVMLYYIILPLGPNVSTDSCSLNWQEAGVYALSLIFGEQVCASSQRRPRVLRQKLLGSFIKHWISQYAHSSQDAALIAPHRGTANRNDTYLRSHWYSANKFAPHHTVDLEFWGENNSGHPSSIQYFNAHTAHRTRH